MFSTTFEISFRTIGIIAGLMQGIIRSIIITTVRSMGTKVSVFKLVHFNCFIQIICVIVFLINDSFKTATFKGIFKIIHNK